jgi:hypothetical protein
VLHYTSAYYVHARRLRRMIPYSVSESKPSTSLMIAPVASISSRYKCHLATGTHESQQVNLSVVSKFRFSHRTLIVERTSAIERLGLCAGIVQQKSSNSAWRKLEGQVPATVSARALMIVVQFKHGCLLTSQLRRSLRASTDHTQSTAVQYEPPSFPSD